MLTYKSWETLGQLSALELQLLISESEHLGIIYFGKFSVFL